MAPTPPRTTRNSAQSPPASGADFVSAVRSHLGAPYIFGAAGPRAFDCSGLVQFSLKQIGINAPRTSEEQFAWSERISDPGPGDLVFFVGSEQDPPPGHVGVVIGPGNMIDAPHTGAVVTTANFSVNGSGVAKFMGYGRIPKLAVSGTSNPTIASSMSTSTTNTAVGGIVTAIGMYVGVIVLVIFALIAGYMAVKIAMS